MYTTDNFNKLKSDLEKSTGKAYFNSSKSELITYCPNCEKSRFFSNAPRGHLYISTDIPYFNCFKCSHSGHLKTLLNEFNLNSDEYASDEYFKLTPIKFKIKNTVNLDVVNNFKTIKLNENKFENKVNYIKNRINLNLEDLSGLILDFEKFFIENKLDSPISNDKNILSDIQENYIGFLSTRKSNIICRTINDRSDIRYKNISTGKKSFFKDFYSISKMENLNIRCNTIVLCEGIFDLYAAYNYNGFEYIKDIACIWAAALGNAYKDLILSTLDYCKLPTANFIILSDSDINLNRYKYLSKNPLINSLVVYYNLNGKDFGENNINPTKYVIK